MCIRQLFPTEAVPEANICIQEKILNSLTKAGDAERSKERRQEVEERLRLLEHALRRME